MDGEEILPVQAVQAKMQEGWQTLELTKALPNGTVSIRVELASHGGGTLELRKFKIQSISER